MKTLKEAYKNYFDIGAAVSPHWLDEAADTLKAHFNSITCENHMKYNGIHEHQYERPPFKRPKPGEKPEMPKIEIVNRERFVHPCLELHTEGADKIYNFALANGFKLRGHTLAWHGSYPWGIFEQLTPEELETNLREHMAFVAKKYPACWCWDVVNEVADDKHGLFLRETVFKNKFGEDYLIKIYSMAREYFPDTVFVCNDYNEWVPHKRESILKIVDTLKANGLVDAIGCQCHVSAFMTDEEFDQIKYAYEAYAKTGLRIHVTEMDVNCVSWKDPKEVTPETLEKQADVYDKMFKLFRDYKDVIDSVTLWGVSDKHTWLNGFKNHGIKNCALLFDTEYNPTLALSRIVDF